MGALTRPALSSFGRQDTLPEGVWGSVSSGSGYAVAISGPAQFLWPQCPQYCHSEKAAWLSPWHHISVRTSGWIPPTPSAPSSPRSCLKLSTTNFAGIFCTFSANGFSKAFLSIELPLSTNYVSVVVVVQLLSHIQLFATPRTAAHHAPLSFTSPRVCSNSYPLSRWCYATISSSVAPSCPQSFPASGSFPMSQLFPSDG